MVKFLVSNGYHNSSSTTAKGILLVGHLIPATASILPGAWLVFDKGKLEVIEVRIMALEHIGLTVSPESTDQLEADGVALYTLYGTEALVLSPG